jgi:hypothetical protein
LYGPTWASAEGFAESAAGEAPLAVVGYFTVGAAAIVPADGGWTVTGEVGKAELRLAALAIFSDEGGAASIPVAAMAFGVV